MSTSADLQKAIADLLAGVVTVPIVSIRKKELASKIAEAAAKAGGLCLYVLPPLPIRAMQGVHQVVFESMEIRVVIHEIAATNAGPEDAYSLMDTVMQALQWRELPGLTSHPLTLASRPVEMAENATDRVIDVIFNVPFQLAPRPTDS